MDNKTKTGLALLGLGIGGAAIYFGTRPAQGSGAGPLPDGNAADNAAFAPPPSSGSDAEYHAYNQSSSGGPTDYSTYSPPMDLGPQSSVSSPSRGNPTTQLYQQRLYDMGYDPGPIDGLNGPFTRRAVMDYQRDHGLTVDGILGPNTMASIDAATGSPAPVSGFSSRPRRWSAH